MQLLNLINNFEQAFPIGTAKKIIKIKNDIVIATYRQISRNNTP